MNANKTYHYHQIWHKLTAESKNKFVEVNIALLLAPKTHSGQEVLKIIANIINKHICIGCSRIAGVTERIFLVKQLFNRSLSTAFLLQFMHICELLLSFIDLICKLHIYTRAVLCGATYRSTVNRIKVTLLHLS